jgi:hypothetical protein
MDRGQCVVHEEDVILQESGLKVAGVDVEISDAL